MNIVPSPADLIRGRFARGDGQPSVYAANGVTLVRRALRSALSGAAGTVLACVLLNRYRRGDFPERVTTITDQEHQ